MNTVMTGRKRGMRIPSTTTSSSSNCGSASLYATISVGQTNVKSLDKTAPRLIIVGERRVIYVQRVE